MEIIIAFIIMIVMLFIIDCKKVTENVNSLLENKKVSEETKVVVRCRKRSQKVLESFWKNATLENVVKKFKSVNLSNDNEENYIIQAIKFDRSGAIIQKLIEFGANVNAKDKKGNTALLWACMKNKSEAIIKILLEAGANVNIRNNEGNSSLIVACKNRLSIDVIDILVKAGANVNIANFDGNTALMYATSNVSIIKRLLLAGADIKKKNTEGNTPLFLNCLNACPYEGIELLIASGADVNQKNAKGQTPLMYACACNKIAKDVVELLINAGADVNIQDKEGLTAFMYAVNKQSSDSIIKTLVDYGADVNIRDVKGRSAVYYFSIGDKEGYISYCIRKYFDVLKLKYDQTCYVDDYGQKVDKDWLKELKYFAKNVVFQKDWDLLHYSNVKEARAKQKNIIQKMNDHFLKLLESEGVSASEYIVDVQKIHTGIEFERYIENILKQAGFDVKVTPATGDQGVDLVASLNGIKYAIQCKYYSKPVGNKAVQEVIAGKGYYKCDVGCVVTNSTYTEAARKLAHSQNIRLLNENDVCDILLAEGSSV